MLGFHGHRRRGDPVAEAPVDHRLRGPESRKRLAALVQVVELHAHELREHSSAAMARQHADVCDSAVGATPPGIVISKAIEAVSPPAARRRRR
jgi:hypothetical protein